jgi:type VI secretion system secreted protein Hcp
MSAFMRFVGGKSIQGESTDSKHEQWVIIQTMSAPIHRSIPEGATDQNRMRGETTMGDVVIVRDMDLSSVKMQEACADGTLFSDVEIEFTTQLGTDNKTYLRYVLSNVIISSYNLHAHHSGQPLPTEEITLAYTKAEWTYTKYDSKTGEQAGKPVASFDVERQTSG